MGSVDMGESRWIVLIDKTPRGPLSESEVRTLIEQKIVRVNDLASKLEVSADGKKAEWKFLWQFPEFDRRRERDGQAQTPPQERREKKTEEKIEEHKKQLLPEELDGIHPEDLSYHSTSVSSSSGKQPFEDTVFEAPNPPPVAKFSEFNWKAFSAIPVMLVAGILAFHFTGSPKPGGKNVPAASTKQPIFDGVKGDPEYERDLSSSSPLSRVKGNEGETQRSASPPPRDVRKQPPPTVDSPAASGPSNTEVGEISYEEYRRRQEHELEQERIDEENALKEEQGDEEAPVKRTKKKVKKRKAASEEEEAQDPLEETIDEEAPEE